ncbi:MAG: transcription elongation factor GreA [delta proteobacterium ML8_F1]|nr:MAG: transcription elongation factor GreA [delta proteobacterium ML8_F1]
MMENKEVLITKEGLEKAKKELDYLLVEKRQEIAEKIKAAREFGDISENSEYDEAKNEQAEIEAKILKLEMIVKNAKIIEESSAKKGIIDVGSKVIVLDVEYNEEETYAIVGSTEADPYENRISNVSPLGSALIGKKVGDVVEVPVPAGVISYKVVNII